MRGKRYTEEFKIEAVKQVTERGHPVSAVASRLGVTVMTQSKQVFSGHYNSVARLFVAF